MTKHGINAWLALSVTFANEIARLCEAVGADAREVERGLRSEPRIGQKAYIRPGAAFAGGTLARDVVALTRSPANTATRRDFPGDPRRATTRTRIGRSAACAPARPARGRDGCRPRPDLQTRHGHPAAQRRGGTLRQTPRGRRARALLRSRRRGDCRRNSPARTFAPPWTTPSPTPTPPWWPPNGRRSRRPIGRARRADARGARGGRQRFPRPARGQIPCVEYFAVGTPTIVS